MSNLTRRDFIGASAMGLLATTGLPAVKGDRQSMIETTTKRPKRLSRDIGFQSFAVRMLIQEDFTGTLSTCKELGFAGVEMCSPLSYGMMGFGNLREVPPEEIKRQIEDTGLYCKSCHFQSREVLGEEPEATADYAAALGLSDVIMSSSGLPGERGQGEAEQFTEWGEKMNKVGEMMKSKGLRLGYHNHSVGPDIGRKPQYELILESVDPELVTMQFQVASIGGGYDVVYYLDKYAGQYSALHLHDYDPTLKSRREGRLGGIVPCGEGMVDWPALMAAAFKSDIAEHGLIVEIETENPLDGMTKSIEYLKTLEI